MVWPHRIERWRRFVNWESKDIPTDLILSIIDHESGGKAGEKSRATTKPADVPTDTGEIISVNRALGLMQIVPAHINAWNEHKTPKLTYQDMTRDDERAARLQIRIGSSILASYIHRLHVYDQKAFPGQTPGTAPPEQLRLALVAYAIGPGEVGGEKGLIPKLEILKSQGRPLTLEALKVTFPKWGYSEKQGKWINRPLHAAASVWSAYKQHAGSAAIVPVGPAPLISSKPTDTKIWVDQWIWPAVIIAGFLLLMNKDIQQGLKGLFAKR